MIDALENSGRRKLLRAAAACSAVAVAPLLSRAQNPVAWPTKAVRLVVPFAAGGPADVLARYIGVKLSAELGQPVVIDNKSGADGTLGASEVARSTDGHTILFSSTGALVIVPSITKNMNYNPDRDLVPIGQAVVTPGVIVVSSKSSIKTLKDLVDMARAQPGKLNFASAGSGTTTQMGGELLKRQAGIFMTHIPYRGAAPAITDVIAGNADLLVADVPAVLPFINGGRLRALGIAGPKRVPQLPSVPTAEEAGVKGVLAGTWYGVMGPSKTPPEIVEKINGALNRVLEKPESQAFFLDQGVDAAANTSQQFAAFIRNESKKWGDLAKFANVTLD